MATNREIAVGFAVNPHKNIKPSGMTVSVKDSTFYSYAAPIARVLGTKLAEVTSRKYSVTTSIHTREVRGQLETHGYMVRVVDF